MGIEGAAPYLKKAHKRVGLEKLDGRRAVVDVASFVFKCFAANKEGVASWRAPPGAC
jgi:hypothetical protein